MVTDLTAAESMLRCPTCGRTFERQVGDLQTCGFCQHTAKTELFGDRSAPVESGKRATRARVILVVVVAFLLIMWMFASIGAQR